MVEVIWLSDALNDLDQPFDFLNEPDPNVASRAVRAILSAGASLANFLSEVQLFLVQNSASFKSFLVDMDIFSITASKTTRSLFCGSITDAKTDRFSCNDRLILHPGDRPNSTIPVGCLLILNRGGDRATTALEYCAVIRLLVKSALVLIGVSYNGKKLF